ncbi:MAG: adenosylcobinamide-GDP ribazoletransferase [Pseudohongiellaceae bacterium]|jgi:adenosylcobinamide-GDP ribazoletransferase
MLNLSLRPLIAAFIFLTRIPMPKLDDVKPEDSGRALAYFPIVGLAIGLLLFFIALLLPLTHLLLAAVLLTFWVFITGGLHIDGLADSADGWLGGVTDKQRSLDIMKDPLCGSAALMTVGSLLILKFAALATILQQETFIALLFAPILGRCVPLILFLTTPYVRKEGLAQHFVQHSSKPAIYSSLLCIFVISFILLNIQQFIIMLILSGLCLLGLRYLMMKRLDGSTGDTNGAAIEIIEVTVLIALAAI